MNDGLQGNLLLNIGPLPNGEIQTATNRLDILKLAENGMRFMVLLRLYETAGARAITERGDKVYLHILKLAAINFFEVPKSENCHDGRKTLRVQSLEDNYIMIDLKGVPLDPVDTIINWKS